MDVPGWVWLVTIAALVGIIVIDLWIVDSRPHVFGVKEATRWILVYIGLGVAFGGIVYWVWGREYATQYFAGYITEYSLSIDNLFVFILIMTSFAVPAQYQHRVLLVGVVIALCLRAVLIFIGAEAIAAFSATFYLFGAILIYTAIKLAIGHDEPADPSRNPLVRVVGRIIPTTTTYNGSKLFDRVDGRLAATPMLLVMIAIGSTDVLFALDSIPAIFGLTQEAYLVFTANAFALMGLRQLYFLVKGLLEKLVYLSVGLALVLGFIGFKLILEALGATTNLQVPQISTGLSLAVIVAILLVTTVVSLLAVKRNPALLDKEEQYPGNGAASSDSD